MKQRISTIACGLVLLCCFNISLQAQQNLNETNTLTAVQTVTDADGVTLTSTETLQKGKHFEDIIQQLGLDNEQQKDVIIRFMEGDAHATTLEGSDEEETIFFYRAAKSEESNDNMEKLQITIDNAVAKQINDKKPLLGVYTEDMDEAVRITGLVYDGGAQKAGIQKGDLLIALESDVIENTADLRAAIAKHQVGDVVMVNILRDGLPKYINVTLGEQVSRGYHNNHHAYAYHYDYENDYYYNSHQERNPCKTFIGVYTSNSRKGLKVHNIIANTPAERSTIQHGDIVVAFDGISVKSHQELISERDQSEAGDYFTLTVLRDGAEVDIDMQFDDCPEETTDDLSDNLEETVLENSLELQNFSAFPNPTYGPVNIKFEGEAKPTTIRILDATGKTVYQEEIINFDGYYNKEVELERASPGTLILTITQDQKVYSETMIFMPRA